MGHGGDIYRNKVHMDYSVNLNPLGAPPEVLDAIRCGVAKCGSYPDISQHMVRQAIAKAAGLTADHVYAGSGASELLMAAVRALSPKTALLFEPCFSGYLHALRAIGCKPVHSDLKEDEGFALTEEDLTALYDDIDLVFVCNPMSPSGLNIEAKVLEKLLDTAAAHHSTVILDESFYLLSDQMTAGDQAKDLLNKYDDLIILRSLTKVLSIPGIRSGYVLSSPAKIQKIAMQLPEWNLSVTSEEAILAGCRIMTDKDFLSQSLHMIREERDYLRTALSDLNLSVFDSNAPYLLFRGPEDLYDVLLGKGILIRDCSDYPGLSKGYYRIGVKNHADNEALIRAIKESLCTTK